MQSLVPNLSFDETKWANQWVRGPLSVPSTSVPIELSAKRLIDRSESPIELQSLIKRLSAQSEHAGDILRLIDLLSAMKRSSTDELVIETPLVPAELIPPVISEDTSPSSTALFTNGLTEELIVKELVYVLQGMDGKVIKLSPDGRVKIEMELEFPFMEDLIIQVAKAGAVYNQIVTRLSSAREPSVLLLAFKTAVVHQLRAHLSLPGLVESDLSQWTLVKLAAYLTVPTYKLEYLNQIVGNIFGNPAAILSRLQDIRRKRSTMRSMVDAIFDQVTQVWLEMIEKWVSRGKLNWSDFFVRVRTHARPARLSVDHVELDMLWNDTFEISEYPEIISHDLANQILYCGKNAAFLAACDQVIPHFREGCFKRLESLSSDMEHAQYELNLAVVDLVMNSGHLTERLRELKRFVLLAQGDFAESLLKLGSKELEKPASEQNVFELRFVVDNAVRLSVGDEEEVLNRLDVKLGLQTDPAETGFDVFSLDLKVEPRLEVVICPDSLGKYRKMFTWLFRVVRCENALGEVWRDLQSLGRNQNVLCNLDNVGLLMDKANTVRSEIWWFVHTLRAVLCYEVIEARSIEFMRNLEQCTSIDSMVQVHHKFLNDIVNMSLLENDHQAVFDQVNAILTLAIRVANAMPAILGELQHAIRSNEDLLQFRFDNISALLDDFHDIYGDAYNAFMDRLEERSLDENYQSLIERFQWYTE